MKKILPVILLLIVGSSAFAQINMEDSTVQVITYWDKGEQQNYTISTEKIKIQGTDTISREFVSYDVEITVLDETEDSYAIQWLYKNVETSNTEPIIQKVLGVSEDTKVIFKTNELGEFIEVENWEEIRDHIQKGMDIVKEEFKSIPELDVLFQETEARYSSKEAIEAGAIQEIQQYHTFHGAAYQLGEVYEAQLKVPNLLGSEPLDADIFVYLDEIDLENNTFILWTEQVVNQEQLINTTLDFVKKVAGEMAAELLGPEEFSDLKNEISTGSRIHESGWVIYSILTKTIVLDGYTNIEERIIDMH